MPAADTISFPNFDPVTGQPAVDGFTGDFDPGFTLTHAEAGFAEADQVSFDGGSVAAPVILKCERIVNPTGRPPGDYLAFSFFCSFDQWFNDEDVVVLAFKAAGGAAQSDTRRVDIHPVRNDIGAGQAADLYTDPATWTPLPAMTTGLNYLRVAYSERTMNVWKGNPAWGGEPDPDPRWLTAAAPNIYARCCSWRPATPNATLNGDANLQAAPTAFQIQVNSTAGFPQSGGLRIDVGGIPRLVTYTSKTATTFDNCKQKTGLAAATVASGTVISHSAVGWSIEVLVPRTAALGGGDWIDLNDGFGLYANIIRWTGVAGGGPDPHAGSTATQYMFPVPELGATRHNITGSLHDDTTLDLDWYGTGLIPALQSPPGSNLGVGVRFYNTTNPELSVGNRDKNLPDWSPLGTTIWGSGTPPPGQTPFDNKLVAQVRNTDTVNAANGVTAEFRFANWGLPAATFPAWAPANGAATPSVVNLSTPAGGTDTAEITAIWDRVNVPTGISAHPHQCIWVQLRTTGGSTVHFVQGGVRRNMNFAALSEHKEEFEVSGEGYAFARGRDLDFVLVPHVREIILGEQDGDDDVKRRRGVAADVEALPGLAHAVPELAADDVRTRVGPRKVWVWIVDGFVRTDETITIGKETAEILDPSPGQFGVVAFHEDPTDALGYRIYGDGFEWQEAGFVSAKVPNGGKLRGTIELHAGPPEEVARIEEQDRIKPPKKKPTCGCLGRLGQGGAAALLLLAIVKAIRR